MAATSLSSHTGAVASDARATTFVTGADGFLGMELVKVLLARGHQVRGLTRSAEAAEALRVAGAIPVIGDPLTPGRWQDEAAADWVFHVPAQPVERERIFIKRTAAASRARILEDANLLDAVASGATRRIVYVADLRCYGAAGPRPITEDEPFRPSPSGRWLMPALERLEGYVLAGLPIVTAIPGCVYGHGSWFRELIVEPIMTGRRVLQFGKTGPWVSPIHVFDCARALVHLAAHGAVGGRYFVVNSEPIRMNEFAKTFARLANRPLRVWRLPAAATRLAVGQSHAAYPQTDAVFLNIRLRGIGFRFEHPSLEQGIRQVLGTLYE